MAEARRGGPPKGEEGRIGLLMGACLLLVVSFVLVSSAVTAVAIEDRRLLSCADRLAAASAGIVDADAYYAEGGTASLVVSRRIAWSVAEDALADMRSSTCDVGEGVVLESVERAGGTVIVRVRSRAVLPLVPGLVDGLVAPVLLQESRARVAALP